MNIALLDADTFIWVAAYNAREASNVTPHLRELDTFIESVLRNTSAIKYAGFLQGKEKSFRKGLFSTYKASRPPVPDWYVKWKETFQWHLMNQWNFQFTTGGFEADDAVVSAALQLKAQGYNPIICGKDKDLAQIEGWFYDTKTAELKFVTAQEAYKNLMIQIMIGDRTDNVTPLRPGFGEARAKAAFEENGEYIWGVFETFCWEIKDPVEAALKFSENVLQVVMKRDLEYKFELTDVIDIKQKILN